MQEIHDFIVELVNTKDAKLKGEHGRKQAKNFAEVTTSIELIDKQIALIPRDVVLDLSKTVLDPCTGDGRYLMRYLYHRLDNIHNANDLLLALSTLHGIELQDENVLLAKQNLIKLSIEIAKHLNIDQIHYVPIMLIVNKNIRKGDFLQNG